jgi:hypothetical protein
MSHLEALVICVEVGVIALAYLVSLFRGPR